MSPWVWLFSFYWVVGWSLADIARHGAATPTDAILAVLCMVGRELALIREGKQ